jgi:hypothetical protein
VLLKLLALNAMLSKVYPPSLPLSRSPSPSLPFAAVVSCMCVYVCVFNVDEESTQMKTRDSVRSSRNWG